MGWKDYSRANTEPPKIPRIEVSFNQITRQALVSIFDATQDVKEMLYIHLKAIATRYKGVQASPRILNELRAHMEQHAARMINERKIHWNKDTKQWECTGIWL